MDFKLRTNAKYFSDEQLLEDLRSVAKKLNQKTVGQREYPQHGQFSCKPFMNRFGSWNKALKKAGLDVSVERIITNEDLFNNLEIIWRKLGRQPYYSEIGKPLSEFSVSTYTQRFGGWMEACASFIKFKESDIEFIRLLKEKSTGKSRVINEKDRLKILKRDNYKCVKCGRSPATHHNIFLHIDHINPFSKGGGNEIDNLQTLCQKCNLGKGNDETV